MHPSDSVTMANVVSVVRYHKPTGNQSGRHERLSAATEAFIVAILESTPPSDDQRTAIRHARAAKMFASAAIALEPGHEAKIENEAPKDGGSVASSGSTATGPSSSGKTSPSLSPSESPPEAGDVVGKGEETPTALSPGEPGMAVRRVETPGALQPPAPAEPPPPTTPPPVGAETK